MASAPCVKSPVIGERIGPGSVNAQCAIVGQIANQAGTLSDPPRRLRSAIVTRVDSNTPRPGIVSGIEVGFQQPDMAAAQAVAAIVEIVDFKPGDIVSVRPASARTTRRSR